jgi:archaellum component FlaC
MTEPDNIVLVYLRRIDEKVDRLADDLRDLKVRMTGVEENLAGVQRRIDRLETRLERIERRLDLVEDPH